MIVVVFELRSSTRTDAGYTPISNLQSLDPAATSGASDNADFDAYDRTRSIIFPLTVKSA
jgi:hypothetical protein